MAWLAISCAASTLSRLLAIEEMAAAARAPSSPRSWKMGSSLSKPPAPENPARTFFKASFMSFSIRSVNSLTPIPATLANSAGLDMTFWMSFWNAVADISTFCMSWSSAEAKPRIWSAASPACTAMPPKRPVKLTMYCSLAVLVLPSSLTAEPKDRSCSLRFLSLSMSVDFL